MTNKQEEGQDYIAKGPKIFLFDIETSPIVAYIWSLRQKFIPIDSIVQDSHVLCWAGKWLGEEKVYHSMLPDFKRSYKRNKKDDYHVVKGIWKILDEADIVVAHNATRFDVPRMNARFLAYGMDPPSKYKVIDTLSVVRREFMLTSNKLDFLGSFFEIGNKNDTKFELWVRCMNGDMDAWEDMINYNIQDVALLEKVYLKVRPWDTKHPNIGLYVDSDSPVCTACGSEDLIKKGIARTNVGMYQRYKCKSCGHPNRGRFSILDQEKRKTLLTNEV